MTQAAIVSAACPAPRPARTPCSRRLPCLLRPSGVALERECYLRGAKAGRAANRSSNRMPSRPGSLCYLLASTDLWGGVKIVFEQAEQLAAHGFDVTIASQDEGPDWYDLGVPLVPVPDFVGRNLPPADCYIGTFWTTVAAAHDTGLGIGAHLIQGYEGALATSEPQRRRIDFVYGLKTVKIAVSPHLAAMVTSRFGEPCRTVRN